MSASLPHDPLQDPLLNLRCMAVVVESLAEVREYFEENGMDVDGMSEEELEEASEVFALPDGTYLIVEG